MRVAWKHKLVLTERLHPLERKCSYEHFKPLAFTSNTFFATRTFGKRVLQAVEQALSLRARNGGFGSADVILLVTKGEHHCPDHLLLEVRG